jgi:hypothetical protein
MIARLLSARSPRPGTRRAFTMIEMVTSCAILSLSMLALGYGLKMALVSTGFFAPLLTPIPVNTFWVQSPDGATRGTAQA